MISCVACVVISSAWLNEAKRAGGSIRMFLQMTQMRLFWRKMFCECHSVLLFCRLHVGAVWCRRIHREAGLENAWRRVEGRGGGVWPQKVRLLLTFMDCSLPPDHLCFSPDKMPEWAALHKSFWLLHLTCLGKNNNIADLLSVDVIIHNHSRMYKQSLWYKSPSTLTLDCICQHLIINLIETYQGIWDLCKSMTIAF